MLLLVLAACGGTPTVEPAAVPEAPLLAVVPLDVAWPETPAPPSVELALVMGDDAAGAAALEALSLAILTTVEAGDRVALGDVGTFQLAHRGGAALILFRAGAPLTAAVSEERVFDGGTHTALTVPGLSAAQVDGVVRVIARALAGGPGAVTLPGLGDLSAKRLGGGAMVRPGSSVAEVRVRVGFTRAVAP